MSHVYTAPCNLPVWNLEHMRVISTPVVRIWCGRWDRGWTWGAHVERGRDGIVVTLLSNDALSMQYSFIWNCTDSILHAPTQTQTKSNIPDQPTKRLKEKNMRQEQTSLIHYTVSVTTLPSEDLCVYINSQILINLYNKFNNNTDETATKAGPLQSMIIAIIYDLTFFQKFGVNKTSSLVYMPEIWDMKTYLQTNQNNKYIRGQMSGGTLHLSWDMTKIDMS